MIEQRIKTSLKNGETLEILLIVPPEQELAPELNRLFGHKPATIRRVLQERLSGLYASESADFFFLGLLDGKAAGHLWYGYGRKQPKPLANFGEVYTTLEHRGKGVCEALLSEFEAHFRSSPSPASFCTCGEEHVQKLYARHGFRTVIPGAKFGPLIFSKEPARAAFDEFSADYYASPGPLTAEPGSISYRHETECLLKFDRNKHHIPSEFAFAANLANGYFSGFYELLHMQQDCRGAIYHALTADKRCVGWRFVMELFGTADSFPVVDYQIHPNFRPFAAQWLTDLLRQAEEQGFSAPVFFGSDRYPEKIATMADAGFHPVFRRRANDRIITLYQQKEYEI